MVWYFGNVGIALLGLKFDLKLKAVWGSKSIRLCVMESGKIFYRFLVCS